MLSILIKCKIIDNCANLRKHIEGITYALCVINRITVCAAYGAQ